MSITLRTPYQLLIASRRFLAAMLLGAALAPLAALAQPQPRPPVQSPPTPSSLLPGRQAPKIEDVWVVCKTHCDLGYTESAAVVLERYRVGMMDNALRLIEADRAKPRDQRFAWSIAGWPLAADILGPLQEPARKARIEQAIREGAIAVHALPATLETDSLDLEDLVRGLIYSSKVARDYGHPLPIAAKMTDVPAHAWVLPTLLHHAGVKFLQLGANYSNRPMLVPGLFWWEGPDGSRLLCNYTPNYGSGIVPPKDWPARNYLCIFMTHDNSGPPSPDEVASLRAEAAKVLPQARLHFGTLDDFAKAILAEKPELPVLRGDMVDPWIHGISSMPIETGVARTIRPLEPALDTLDTELRSWGLATAALATDLAKAYEQSMLYGEHTWGASSPWYGFWSNNIPNRGFLYGAAFKEAKAKGLYSKFEGSFNDHRAYIRQTESLVNGALKSRLGLLAQSVKVSGQRLVVFNPLPWSRSGTVSVPCAGEFSAVRDVATGKIIEADSIDGEIRFHTPNLPGNGYRTFVPVTGKASPSPAVSAAGELDTPFFKVTFDLKRGGIASLIEKASGREWVDRISPYALGQFIHERFSHAQCLAYYNAFATMNNCYNGTVPVDMPEDIQHSLTTPADWQLKVRRTPFSQVAVLTAGDAAGLARQVSITFTFHSANPCVDAEWGITDKQADPLPEGGWLCFPFAVEQPSYVLGRLGGAIDLAKDQLPGGNRHLYAVNSGLAVTAPDHAGFGLCTVDAPNVSLGEPGLWKYTFDYFPKQPSVFVNLYNNMWRTDYPYWVEGSWSSRVRIWPARGGTLNESLTIPSWEARLPLLAAAASGPAGKLPPSQTGLTLSRPGVLVTAFGPDPDGNPGTLLRVWDQSGVSGPLTITLPAGSTSASAKPLTLRGEATGPALKIQRGQFTIPLGPFAPASFSLAPSHEAQR